MKTTFTTTLSQMLTAFEKSEVEFLCDLILEMHGEGLERNDWVNNKFVEVDVLEVLAATFPTRIDTVGSCIIESWVTGGYMYSMGSDEYNGPRNFRMELMNKLLAEFGDVELTFTITEVETK